MNLGYPPTAHGRSSITVVQRGCGAIFIFTMMGPTVGCAMTLAWGRNLAAASAPTSPATLHCSSPSAPLPRASAAQHPSGPAAHTRRASSHGLTAVWIACFFGQNTLEDGRIGWMSCMQGWLRWAARIGWWHVLGDGTQFERTSAVPNAARWPMVADAPTPCSCGHQLQWTGLQASRVMPGCCFDMFNCFRWGMERRCTCVCALGSNSRAWQPHHRMHGTALQRMTCTA